MSNEQANEPAPRRSPRLRGIVKKSIAEALENLDHVEEKAGAGRLQFIGALVLGVCIVFLASMLSLPRLDTALQVAVGAFAVGIPVLVLDYTFASLKFGPELRKLFQWYSTGVQIAAWAIGDSVGGGCGVRWRLRRCMAFERGGVLGRHYCMHCRIHGIRRSGVFVQLTAGIARIR